MNITPPLTILICSLSLNSYADSPGPGEVTVDNIRYGGSGCPQDSVGAYISEDAQALTLSFDEFFADTSASESGIDRKNCRVDVELQSPPGWEYSLFCIDFRGFADLEAGAQGQTSAKFSFDTNISKELATLNLEGPFSDDYEQLTAIPLTDLPWSKCGANSRTLTIETSVSAKSKPQQTVLRRRFASGRYRYQPYPMAGPVTNMVLVRRYSSASCVLNRSFGFSGNTAWVTRGCQGDFDVTIEDPGQTGGEGLMTVDTIDGEVKHHYGVAWRRCSENTDQTFNRFLASGGYRYTPTDLGAPVKNMVLVAQHSRSRCTLNRSFGFFGTTVWVARGCRGEFAITVSR